MSEQRVAISREDYDAAVLRYPIQTAEDEIIGQLVPESANGGGSPRTGAHFSRWQQHQTDVSRNA